jgi:hypothetical protein
MSKTTKSPREELRGQVRLKQGDIIEIASALLPSTPLPKLEKSRQETLVIVVSHDCDIYASAQTEPFIEVIPIELIEKLDPRMTHTKNPRTLCLEAHIRSGNTSRPIKMDAPSKASILKASIWDRNFSSPLFLDAEYLGELVDWLSARYRRAALPSEFDRRFKTVREAFWKLVQNYNHDMLAILFIFDEGQEKKECAKGEPYTISITIVFQKGKTESDFDLLIEKIYALFESNYNDQSSENAPKIEIRQCLAISESEITLEAYKAGVYIRSEWISYGTDPHGPIISV